MATRVEYNLLKKEVEGDLKLEDSELITSLELPSTFDSLKDRIDLFVNSIDSTLLEEQIDYKDYGLGSKRLSTESTLLILDPIENAKSLGYNNGDVLLTYNFLKDPFSEAKEKVEFFIKEISSDRTELLISPIGSVPNLDETVRLLKSKLESNQYLGTLKANFNQNRLVDVLNIDLYSPESFLVAVKLYEPIPVGIELKGRLSLDEKVVDSVIYEITAQSTFISDPIPTLRGPNFNLPVLEDISNPTEYLSEDSLNYTLTGSNYEVYSLFNEKGIEISIDHTDFSNFVHFSSAEERIRNFKYKLELIESYEESKTSATTFSQPSSSLSSSVEYYDNLIQEVVNNFDHYDRFLYFESGSFSWPKANSTRPYENTSSVSTAATTFFNNLILSASDYDSRNKDRLINTIPTLIREDSNNSSYLLFVDMIGQHFDNLWIYTKAVTDKYDTDNRLDYGISKDLVAEALTNFGIKLYGSDYSIDNLFSTYTGELYNTGSETINNFISASNQPISRQNYFEEVYKRIYHNISLLVKSKGTDRGLRTLINTFGIPNDFLDINYFGGINFNETPFFGDALPITSSLGKIRINNTGSISSGNTLSDLTSIIRDDINYTQDLHTLDIGFSPSTYINSFLTGSISSSFDLNDYIGDVRYSYSSSYESLDKLLRDTTLTGSVERYNVKDFVRLAKFYNNNLFRMLKDFVPARTNLNTGVIIKPNILDRSKVKQVELTTEQPEYSGSIEIVTVSGSDGNIFTTVTTGSGEYSTNYSYDIILSSGSISTKNKTHEEAKYDGELSGSELSISDGELNRANTYKANNLTPYSYVVRPVTEPPLDLRITGVVSHISP